MRAITLAVSFLLGTLVPPTLQAAAADCRADTSHALVLSTRDQQLLEVLGAHASNSHTPGLIRYNDQAGSINKPILGNYARLRLAAMALRDGDTDFARQQLSQVEQNSPAAVDAALLLAESYRRDGDRQRARTWFVRIAARFPGNPRAVSGLVLAGDDWRKQGAMEQALPVYNLALNKVAENMKALQTLADDPDRLYRSLTNSVAGNSTTVMDQLVLAMVRDRDSQVLDATRKLINASNVRKCLHEQEKTLHNAIQHATARDLSNGAFRTAARREKAATEQEIADLQRVLANAPNAEDFQVRLTEARDRLQRINERLQRLGSTALPPELEERKRQMQTNKQRVETEIEDARQQVRQALKAQLPELQRFYRNLAGEAQLGKAQLLQARG
ncbi:lipopolysaccharide assembly protein LapB [Alcanivorax jadensis]|uniref:tetratricopeptide repeat protein n=1 Tax=Alcanivorax jadensis TaxID=64988 RepID=UPI0026EBC9DE|nr:tetratricopeptide repeat protein [Alcanivorax jadensis]